LSFGPESTLHPPTSPFPLPSREGDLKPSLLPGEGRNRRAEAWGAQTPSSMQVYYRKIML